MVYNDDSVTMKAPLKSVLKNFLDHVEDLEARRKISDDQYETEFQELKKLTDKLKEDPAYSFSFGLKDVNRPKNRYKDIVPYDFSRVILPKHEGIPGSDYINASYIKGASGAFAYIAAQGPLPNTVMDFWRMIWICDVQVVVMACNEREAGKFKCEPYWPEFGEVKQYGNISIELIKTAQVCPDFLVRTFLVTCNSEVRDVYQFHYTSWPDHGVPDTVQPILDLVRLMRDCQASETVPIVVHCSAGCGRTGTICAVDYVWACLRHGRLDEDFSLYQIALELRRQRIAMIQTKEQYILAHKAVAAMFEQQLRVIDCHIYENIDEDGEPLVWKEVGKDKELNYRDIIMKTDSKEKTELMLKSMSGFSVDRKTNSNIITSDKSDKIPELKADNISRNSSVGNNLNKKVNPLECVNSSSKNSESSYSRNSILSEHSTEDSIPFIDDDDVCIRPNCGRAYLDIPSCDSISKLMNCFDPFVDKVSLGTDDSSPDGDPIEMNNKMKDFQSASSKTLDKDVRITSFSNSGSKQIDSRSDIVDCLENAKKSSLFCYRESYPPCSNSEKFQKNFPSSVDKMGGDSSEDVKSAKKIGKATVVRRPSISKLKALFEKSSISPQKCSNDGSKRLLFRHNSHHVSRAGSAPPSLDCMDKGSAVEKESILKMVTRKFRSSSVRTEKEMQSKQDDKTLNRRSATDTVKDGFNALTRTMSFSLNKTFKSYSPSKAKPDSNSKSSASTPTESIAGIYKPKSPDSQKGNSMWYDKSYLSKAVAVVKPTGKFESDSEAKSCAKSPSEQKSPDKNKSHETNFNYITKPAKLKDFFSSLNKKDAKDATTLWYNESNTNILIDSEKPTDSDSKPDMVSSSTKSTSKVLPFLQLSAWKKVGQKSPLSSPDSPKNFSDPPVPQNSKFYTNVLETAPAPVNSTTDKNLGAEAPKCPVPEEIIPLSVNSEDNKFWPSNSLPPSKVESENDVVVHKDAVTEQVESENNVLVHKDVVTEQVASENNLLVHKDIVTEQTVDAPFSKPFVSTELIKQSERAESTSQSNSTELVKHYSTSFESTKQSANSEMIQHPISSESIKISSNIRTNAIHDVPPAIPKKMVIGKKNLQISVSDKTADTQCIPGQQIIIDKTDKGSTEIIAPSEEMTKPISVPEKNDHYINVNIKAKKNIEQIEKTIQKNPRSAIIDLTSRESYSMEEELVNAVNQLSGSSEKHKVPSSSSDSLSTGKTPGVKNNSKFPGYEVIWPEEHYPIQKSRSSGKVPLTNKSKLIDKSSDSLHLNYTKTGLCYSPPLRRSVNTSLVAAKSQSCGNLDWLDRDLNFKEQSSTPTKKLVNEAVVELNTLLNQLTTRTLSEDVDINSSTKEKIAVNEGVCQKAHKSNKESNIGQNDTVVHSVTLVTKSYNTGSSPKEEEIVFHFPPPPRVPPPKDETPTESFEIVCKGRSLKVKENIDTTSNNTPVNIIKKKNTDVPHDTLSENISQNASSPKIPQPAPRKSKNSGDLRRSSSYSNIGPTQSKDKGYENIFLEKYQTLSKLEIKPNYDHKILDKVVPLQKSPIMPKLTNTKNSSYVNIGDVHFAGVSDLPVKSAVLSDEVQSRKNKETHMINVSKNQALRDSPKMIIDESGSSVYGKIYKMFDKKNQSVENSFETKNINLVQDFGEVKKKPVLFKKTERAPLPPNMKQAQSMSNEGLVKMSPNNSLIPKKLPSRKLERAPAPPNLLQKSSSAMNVPQKNLQNPQSYVNIPALHHVDEKHKLPAVHENVPNVTDNTKRIGKINTSVINDKFVNRGLSHSQSDVSVYLALKERRIQSANQERKILNMESLLKHKRKTNDLLHMSSSDSDSSYERIFLTKKDEPTNAPIKPKAKEQIEQITRKSHRKEVPVAPPRSKRRSTTEVQYTKVKAKDASLISSTSLQEDTETKNSKTNSSASEDDPPAIPMKTKDAFEIPEEDFITDMNKIQKEELQQKP